MSFANPRLASCTHGELLKLGIRVSQANIDLYVIPIEIHRHKFGTLS